MNLQSDRHRRIEDDDEIDLGPGLRALLRHRVLIAATGIMCAVLTYAVARFMAPTYEATARLIVNHPPNESAPPSMSAYSALLENQGLAADVIKDAGLGRAPYGASPRSFFNDVLAIDIVPDSNIIALRVRLTDPSLAARVANLFLERAVGLAESVSQRTAIRARDRFKAELDEVAARFTQTQQALRDYRKSAQIDLVKSDITALLGHRSELINLTVDIETEKARLKAAEAELAGQSPTGVGRTAVDVSSALALDRDRDRDRARDREQQRPRTAEEPTLPLRGDATSPFVDPVYEILRHQVATSRTRLAGLERRRVEISQGLKLSGRQLAELSEMYQRQTDLTRLEAEYDLMKQVYTDVATRFEQARLQVAERSAHMQELDRALVPVTPVSPRPKRAAAIALVVGLLLGGFGVLAFHLAVRFDSAPPAAKALAD